MPLPRLVATHVRAHLRQGSSSPVLVDTTGGRFVAKLVGAAQGTGALIAEIVVAELAEQLGLPVPERVLIEFETGTPSDDAGDELADLLAMSQGTNLGFRWLESAHTPRPDEIERIDDAFAARVLWLDGLTLNPDRSRSNPNLLIWRGQSWLIDHGATLGFQYDWASVDEAAPREPMNYAGHVFEQRTPLLEVFDQELAGLISREGLQRAIAAVPDTFLLAVAPKDTPARMRAAYHAFLWKRLKAPRPFIAGS